MNPPTVGEFAGMAVDTKMGELIASMPGARRSLFARYHLGGCQSCAFDEGETLANLCKRSELDSGEVLVHLLPSHEHDLTMLIAPDEVKRRLDADEEIRWVDVRTREEYEAVIARKLLLGRRPLRKLMGGPEGGAIFLRQR